VAALAYLLPPVSGLVAYFGSGTRRTRFHGLQSVLLGTLWPAALLGGALVSPGVTQAAAAGGLIAWLTFLIGAGLGRDPRWPGVGRRLWALAERPPR
jgi:hypothetical protein